MQQFNREAYLMKLMLVLMRDRKARQGQVRSVGYLREYGELPEEMGVLTLGQLSDDELLSLAEDIGVKKRPATGKSDIYMNDMGYTLHSTKQDVVIAEKISLQELITAAEQLGSMELIEPIKNLVNEIKLQQAVEGGPNIVLAAQSSLFTASRQQWIKLLSFILCNGINPTNCRFPADLVLQYADPLNMNSWDIYNPDSFIDKMWDTLRIELYEDDSLSILLHAAQ